METYTTYILLGSAVATISIIILYARVSELRERVSEEFFANLETQDNVDENKERIVNLERELKRFEDFLGVDQITHPWGEKEFSLEELGALDKIEASLNLLAEGMDKEFDMLKEEAKMILKKKSKRK